jgi:predicted Zn-dependent protease
LHSDRPDLKWTFGVIESKDINAFAAPGGYIFVTRGLYARLRDESELAGVLAHEIAHVQERHHLKVLQKSQAVDLGARLLRQRVAEAGSTAQRLIGSGAEIMARGLDKDAEFEADRVGVVLATRAGYDPCSSRPTRTRTNACCVCRRASAPGSTTCRQGLSSRTGW